MPVYTVNRRCQLKTLNPAILFVIIIGIISGTIVYSVSNTPHDLTVAAALLLFMLMLLVPVGFLHIYYLKHNKAGYLEYNDSGVIKITHNGLLHEYMKEDLVAAYKYLQSYYPYESPRTAVPWSDYGYIKLEFKDGKMFFFSSLMLDVLKADFLLFKVRYSFFPLFNRSKYVEEQAIEQKLVTREELETEKEYLKYREMFTGLPDEDLLYKIANKEKYMRPAIKAAKDILNERGIVA